MVLLNCLSGVAELVKAINEDVVEVVIRWDDGCIHDGLEVFLDFIKFVLVLAVSIW